MLFLHWGVEEQPWSTECRRHYSLQKNKQKNNQDSARKRACEPRGRLEAPTGAQEASRSRPGAAREEPRDAQEPPKAGQVASKIQLRGDSRECLIPFLVSYTIYSTSWPWCVIRTLFTAFRGPDARSVHYLQHFVGPRPPAPAASPGYADPALYSVRSLT